MAQYLVAIHHPDNYDASKEDEAMSRGIAVLNEEMIAAGVRIFAGGRQRSAGKTGPTGRFPIATRGNY